jgi:tRNA uridine 5-carboxymethylaminomethyl modification enzyme
VTVDDLPAWLPSAGDDRALLDELAEDAAYAPYLARQEAEMRDLRANEAVRLELEFPYSAVPGLSHEMVERLEAAQPDSLAAAARVPGITPAALAAVLVHARRRERVAA